MKPSAYIIEGLSKDVVLEDRDRVRVEFIGGNVIRIYAEGAAAPETVRGGKKAWARAEELRKELNADYAGPPIPPEGDETKASDEEPPAPTPAAAKAPPSVKGGEGGKKPENGPEKISIGGVEGVLELIPVADVAALLGGSLGRVDALQLSVDTRRLQHRVGATDGRCAPIFFGERDGELLLFDGLSTFAAALNLGMDRVAVVIMPADEIGAAQGVVAAMRTKSLAKAGDEEEMLYRAYND